MPASWATFFNPFFHPVYSESICACVLFWAKKKGYSERFVANYETTSGMGHTKYSMDVWPRPLSVSCAYVYAHLHTHTHIYIFIYLYVCSVYIYILYVHIFCICIVSFCLLNMGRLMANTTWATSPGLFWGYSIPTYLFRVICFIVFFKIGLGLVRVFFKTQTSNEIKKRTLYFLEDIAGLIDHLWSSFHSLDITYHRYDFIDVLWNNDAPTSVWKWLEKTGWFRSW